jgi:hypothetical protein
MSLLLGLEWPYLTFSMCKCLWLCPCCEICAPRLTCQPCGRSHRHHDRQPCNSKNDCATITLRARLMEKAEWKSFDCDGLSGTLMFLHVGSSIPRGFASAKMLLPADFASSFGSKSWLASWKAVAFDATPSVDHTGSSALDRCLS